MEDKTKLILQEMLSLDVKRQAEIDENTRRIEELEKLVEALGNELLNTLK